MFNHQGRDNNILGISPIQYQQVIAKIVPADFAVITLMTWHRVAADNPHPRFEFGHPWAYLNHIAAKFVTKG
jgi:hypothetical protein